MYPLATFRPVPDAFYAPLLERITLAVPSAGVTE
jgi:hypothetical protein